MPPTAKMRQAMKQRQMQQQGSGQMEKSVYERITGNKNPAWADKIYNGNGPTITDRIANWIQSRKKKK